MSFVSVIIPNYNCAAWLPQTLESCIQQKEFIKEIIIIDDFSTDTSWEILVHYAEKHSQFIRIYKNLSKGGNNARNLGFSFSTGDYIQWLDADDQLLPGKFSAQLNIFKINSSADIVYSDWQLNTYRDGIVQKRELKKTKEYPDFLYELLINNWSPPSNYLLNRGIASKLNDLKGWNEATQVGQDREYFTLGAIVQARFCYVSGVYSIYNRWNKLSVSTANQELRYASVSNMLNRFEILLEEQQWLSSKEIKKYIQIIETEKLYIASCGYPVIFKEGSPRFLNVKWLLYRGIRTRARMAYLIIRNGVRNNAGESKGFL